jgi:hypothetical protein
MYNCICMYNTRLSPDGVALAFCWCSLCVVDKFLMQFCQAQHCSSQVPTYRVDIEIHGGMKEALNRFDAEILLKEKDTAPVTYKSFHHI